jgi:hypothetical protein
MELIVTVTKSMYSILERMAEREIERDPIGFIREESFVRPQEQKEDKMEFGSQGKEEKEDFEELKIEKFEPALMNDNIIMQMLRKPTKEKEEMYNPSLIEELEEVFHSAHDVFVSTLMGPKRQ